MSDFAQKTPQELELLINSGESNNALEKINTILNSKTLAKNTRLDYLILKVKALTRSDQYFHAMNLLDEIEKDILQLGNDLHQIDFYQHKAENLFIFGKATSAMEVLENAENSIEDLSKNDKASLVHKKIDLLILKSKLISSIHGYTGKLHEVLELCLELCNESDYLFGKAKTYERMAASYIEMGEKEKAFECTEEAFSIWESLKNKYGIGYTTFVKGNLKTFVSIELAQELCDKALKINKEINAKKNIARTLNSLGIISFLKEKEEEGLEYFEESMKIHKEIGFKHAAIIQLYNMGEVYSSKMEFEKALSYLYEGLSLAKELDFERPSYLIKHALNTIYFRKGELNKALKFSEEAIQFYEEKNMQENLAWSRNRLADILVLKGDLDTALKNFFLCLDFYEKENRLGSICYMHSRIAEIYQIKGDYDLALKYFNKSQEIAIKNDNRFYQLYNYFYLINYYLDINDLEHAETNLENLQQLSFSPENKTLVIISNLAEALVLSKRENAEDRKKARGLYEKVISAKEIEHRFAVSAILNLCELLIVELRATENLELLDELKKYVEQLHQEGSSELAYPLLVQSIWIQSNISLIELDVNKARRLFKSAQVMAEAKNLHNLARRISNNYDILLGQLDLWEQFTMQLPSIAERMELTHIETVLDEMIKGRGIVFSESEIEKEEPVLISIFTEKGVTLFLEQLNPEIVASTIDEIWSTVIDMVQKESKTGAIERKKIQDYTCLIKKLDSLVFCYMFIGKSYEGIRKLEEFSQLVYGTSQIWEEFEELAKVGGSTDFDFQTLITSSTRDQSIEYSSRFILNQYVDNIFQ